ncbi:MAG: aldo/keto reductase, partial [Actinomycetia bacterium]|nr:aldo/keto reductase [Actinomycetes bacterium]
MTSVPSIKLNDGRTMPLLGFGLFQVAPEDTVASVRAALQTGYRSIDTAALYRNEKEAGIAIGESGLAREDLFVTTKVWNTDQGYDATLRAFDASLALLGLDHVDLYLIHWPMPARGLFVDTWRALERLAADGRARSIGVSNFKAAHLRALFEQTDVVPAVNQVELHP